MMKTTNAQNKKIEWLRQALLEYHSHGSSEYEYKQFDIQLLDSGRVSLVSEIGLIGDEQTYACVFARDCRHIFIGRKGGLSLAGTSVTGDKVVYAVKKEHKTK